MCQFLVKMNNFEFFGPNLSKKRFRVGNWENYCGNENQHHWDTLCTTLTFLAQILPKMDLRSEIQKAYVGIRISIVKMLCVPIFRKNGNFDLFDPNLPKNEIWSQNFKNLSPDSESALPRHHVCSFSVKTENFDFFGLNLPKMEMRIRNSEN